jgi:sialate O-acetylesterase
MKLSLRISPVVLTLSLLAPLAQADVSLSPIIGSHMVLQRGVACPIWGWAEAGEEVSVEFAGQKVTGKAGEDGKWMVKLTPMKATAAGANMTITGKNTIALEDVVVGEVWLCSGQSNMEWVVKDVQNAQTEIAAATDGMIRHLKVNNPGSGKPMDKVQSGGWQAASPQTVGGFTAAGYFFAREVRKELGVPIGLLGANWGGTRIEPWTPPVGFKEVPALKDIADKLDEFPKGKNNGRVDIQSPLALFNGRIAPLVPYAIRGALWYQGESNNGEGMLYFEKMKALIVGWRKVWEMPTMPFYFVELAPYNYGGSGDALAMIWEAQAAAATNIPQTGMSGTTDIGNVKDIHPRNKQEVGRRLALLALTKTYGKSVGEISGPVKKDVKFDGAKAVVTFEHAAGLKTRDGQPPTHFMLAGEDKNFVAAKAEISGETVVVTAEGVTKPVALRFGFNQMAEPNLANGAGLPARPFRTDDYPAR